MNSGQPAASENLTLAKELIQTARFDQAISLLENLLASEPDHDDRTEVFYMLAVAQRYGKQPDKALATLDTLLGDNPEYARAHQERGHLFLSLNRSEDAALAYARAVDLNPALHASLKALVNLGEHAGRKQQAQVARERLDFLKRLPPELVNVLDLIHENKLYKAERLCRDYLQAHKHHIEAMRLLAEIGIRLNIYDDAEFLLESCVEFAPDHVQARIDYVNILIRKTRFEKAHEQQSCWWNWNPITPASGVRWQPPSSASASFPKGSICIKRYWTPIPTAMICTCNWAMRRKPRGCWTLPLIPTGKHTGTDRISAMPTGVSPIPRPTNSRMKNLTSSDVTQTLPVYRATTVSICVLPAARLWKIGRNTPLRLNTMKRAIP